MCPLCGWMGGPYWIYHPWYFPYHTPWAIQPAHPHFQIISTTQIISTP